MVQTLVTNLDIVVTFGSLVPGFSGPAIMRDVQ